MHRQHLADLNIPQHSRGLRAGAGRREPGANCGLLALQVLEVLKNEALLPSSDEGGAFRRHQTSPDFIWISPEVIVRSETCAALIGRANSCRSSVWSLPSARP